MGRSRNILLSVLIMLTVVGTVSQAEIPQVISYQGKVTDASGNPVANGSYTMRFRIYNVSAGGTALWDSGDRSISVAGGIFSVLLGESPQPALTLDFSADYWLLATFAGVDQSPRQRLASIGYAFMASGLVPGTEVSGSVTSGTCAAFKGTNTETTGTTYGGRFEASSTGGRGVYGEATASTGTTYGVYALCSSTAGRGVFSHAFSTSGETYGGYFRCNSSDGIGVYAEVSATTGYSYAVRGTALSSSGTAVAGEASAITGSTNGVWGFAASSQGRAVYGTNVATTGNAYGGDFETYSPNGYAVRGFASRTGGTNYGVFGESASTSGRGVYGEATATTGPTYGVYGKSVSTSGYAVYGEATATSQLNYGGYFKSAGIYGRGVSGWASSSTGTTYGGRFENTSTSGTGVYGWAYASTGTTYGVHGECSSPSGYGGYFSGRLRATASINAGATPGNHVAEILNSSTGTSPDVLCLKVGYTGNPGSTINYLTFLKGDDTGIGAVEGDGAGGVTFLSGGSDYAEYLPKMDAGEALEPGDVVGVFDGKVTKKTDGASQVMVVSTRPIVVGNSPGEERAAEYARVAFIGQVEVKVRGPVQAGDLLMPSRMDDGTAVAVSRDEVNAEQFRQVFGQAWEGSGDGGVTLVRAAVCLVQHDPNVARVESELRAEIAALQARLTALEESR